MLVRSRALFTLALAISDYRAAPRPEAGPRLGSERRMGMAPAYSLTKTGFVNRNWYHPGVAIEKSKFQEPSPLHFTLGCLVLVVPAPAGQHPRCVPSAWQMYSIGTYGQWPILIQTAPAGRVQIKLKAACEIWISLANSVTGLN